MRIAAVFGFALLLSIMSAAPASAQSPKAPEWEISEWINGPGVSLADLKGRVVIVEFFQLWCPGCNQFSIPLMKRWHETFEKEIASGTLAMLSIHTVFEGHGFQTPRRLRSFVKEKQIEHLVGIDTHISGERIPETMKKYRTGGTPHMVFIDKKGFIRFNRFGGFDPDAAERFIRGLLAEPAA